MTIFKRHEKRTVTILDGLWDFTTLPDVTDPEAVRPDQICFTDRLPVPCAHDAFPAYAGYRGVAAYRTQLDIEPGRNAFLRFEGLGMWSRIFVDGIESKTSALPYSRIEVNVSSSMNRRRELVVVNDNRFSRERVPLQENSYDFHAYGGIFRSVECHVHAPVFFRRAQLTPDATTGSVTAVVHIGGMTDGTLAVAVSVDGRRGTAHDLAIRNGVGTLSFSVPNHKLWSAATPNLHTVAFETDTDDLVERIGFRTLAWSGNALRVNGEAVKLLGYCRHESHPQTGPAMTPAQHVQDLQLLRDLGCNFIRGSHYPQDPVFLDLCDEMGFYVFEESLGWGNRQEHFDNPAFCRQQVEQTRLMVEKSVNHPCVILWGFLNEGASNAAYAVPLYRDLSNLLHAADPTRPVTYASMFAFDDLCYEFADIISINAYPGWYAHDQDEVRPLHEIGEHLDRLLAHLAQAGQGDKPLLISEIGAGAIYGWRDPLKAHWSEEYQADYLRATCERVVADDRIAGVALWQFCDGRTYASARALGRPRGFNNKGTFDEYRRPKMAAQAVRGVFRR